MADLRHLTVVYEHPHWFKPLFTELDRRGIPHTALDRTNAAFDPRRLTSERDVVFNRISVSSWTRGRGELIAEAGEWLATLERNGVDTINGGAAFAIEVSKAAQLELLARIGVRAPRTQIVAAPRDLVRASGELTFPLVVKPNIGGSGAGISLFRSAEELTTAVAEGRIEQPLGDVLLLQEYHAPRGRSIVRIETLGAASLYAVRIHLAEDAGFDLCPADVCRTTAGAELQSSACPAGAEKQGLTVEAYTPPAEVIETVERIARESRLDVGGIEYLESDRDGEIYYYDINALSNFVADPLRVIGFDPTARLVDAIVDRLRGIPNTMEHVEEFVGGAR